MNPPIEVLYAPSAYLYEADKFGGKTPVVRYSDHCAEMERNTARVESLLREIESLTATCERLQAEVTVAKYSQQATNDMIASVQTPAEKARAQGLRVAGRWDGKPKAL